MCDPTIALAYKANLACRALHVIDIDSTPKSAKPYLAESEDSYLFSQIGTSGVETHLG